MRTHRRAAVLIVLVLAGAGALGLTGCGRPGVSAADAGAAAELDLASATTEVQALAALGFEPAELAAVETTPSPTATPRRGDEGKHRRPLRRELLRGRVLHAEAVVQTKDGTRVLVSQRGTITDIEAESVTVKSSDGFTLTWAFGDNLRVVERRRAVQPDDLKAGDEIGLAGAKEGDRSVARLIVHRVPG